MDGTFRMHVDGTDIAQASMISTFSEWTVLPEASAVKIPEDVDLRSACLLGCGVPTGWGSAAVIGDVQPGDVVIVVGVGGIGVNALQGARHCSANHIIAVDTNAGKEGPARTFGATRFTTSFEEAADLGRSLTNGQGADVAIVTVSNNSGAVTTAAVEAIRKGGTVVVTATGDVMEPAAISFNPASFPMYQKRIQGTLYGGCSPQRDIPRLLGMYQTGNLMLDELITKTYPLSAINEGYADMHSGKNVRGVIDFSL
jgi:S-(hydroxymethyl)glutathione dehydrogenase/alcohol dehydrogenase